jgi:acetate kinase
MRVLCVNAGSSSVKLSVVEDDGSVAAAQTVDTSSGGGDDEVMQCLRTLGHAAGAVGHRVVHGGERFVEAVRLDGGVVQALHDLCDLAPLHQPKSLRGIDLASAALPHLPAVACFDTAFHATLPPAARTYAIPQEWRDAGVRRYGFHGLSHAYIARRAPQLLGITSAGLRLVSCHLGAGASLAAVLDGSCADTTMGFTPLEGLVMATRSGSIDPGAVLWLVTHQGMPAADVADALEHSSGMAALCGTADMREARRRADSGDSLARAAFDILVHRLAQSVAAMAASLGGVDVLVFTGGVGEHDAALRADTAVRLGFLGVSIDAERNARTEADADISDAASAVRVAVVTAHEDVEIARQTRAVLLA